MQGENIVQVSVIPIGPEMVSGGRINQLGDDPHPMVGSTHTPLEEVLRPGFLADPMPSDWLVLGRSHRVAGNDEGAGEFGEIRDEHVGYANAEILLLRVAAQVVKWQNCNGG